MTPLPMPTPTKAECFELFGVVARQIIEEIREDRRLVHTSAAADDDV